MENKFNFSAISKTSTYKPGTKEKSGDKYVKYGDRNDFPDYLIELKNNSSIHNTCINAIVDGIVGEGLVAEPEFVLDVANQDGESWNDIFKKVALDYKLYGGFALEVIWNKPRTKIAEVYHIDFSYLRASEKDYRGKIPGYYISDCWGDIRATKNVDDLPYLPVYNPFRADAEAKQVYVYTPYSPGQKYYPLPDYMGALTIIGTDIQVDDYHSNNLANGMSPSLAITTYTNADPDERQAIEQMLRAQYAGTGNAGNILYLDVDSPENAPTIEPIPSNGNDSYYTDINSIVLQKVLTAHRITSGMILGIKEAGSLGGRQEVLDAYLLLLNTVIRPYQQNILSVFEELLEEKYPEMDITLGVQQLKLFNDGEEETDVVTSIDAEIGDDSELETKIEEAE